MSIFTAPLFLSKTWNYIFKSGRLYLVVRSINDDLENPGRGEIVQLEIYNRGQQVERDINIELAQSGTVGLIASEKMPVTQRGNVICIERLSPLEEVCVTFRISGVHFTQDRILSVSSTNTSGKICKRRSSVPSNPIAKALLALILFLAAVGVMTIVGVPIYVVYTSNSFVHQQTELRKKVAPLVTLGWDYIDLEEYESSKLSKAYARNELPIVQKSAEWADGYVIAVFRIDNKTSTTMKVYGSIDPKTYASKYGIEWRGTSMVEPHSSGELRIRSYYSQLPTNGYVVAHFTITQANINPIFLAKTIFLSYSGHR